MVFGPDGIYEVFFVLTNVVLDHHRDNWCWLLEKYEYSLSLNSVILLTSLIFELFHNPIFFWVFCLFLCAIYSSNRSLRSIFQSCWQFSPPFKRALSLISVDAYIVIVTVIVCFANWWGKLIVFHKAGPIPSPCCHSYANLPARGSFPTFKMLVAKGRFTSASVWFFINHPTS